MTHGGLVGEGLHRAGHTHIKSLCAALFCCRHSARKILWLLKPLIGDQAGDVSLLLNQLHCATTTVSGWDGCSF